MSRLASALRRAARLLDGLAVRLEQPTEATTEPTPEPEPDTSDDDPTALSPEQAAVVRSLLEIHHARRNQPGQA